MSILELIRTTATDTVIALIPIATIFTFVQVVALRRPIPHLRSTLVGFGFVVVGITLFLVGLQLALFPLGMSMAEQLVGLASTSISPGGVDSAGAVDVWRYWPVLAFGLSVGFASALAEPALMAVALKASEVSAGGINPLYLRIAVAIGAGTGISLGCLRIITGTPIVPYIAAGYTIIAVQALRAPREIVALAFDTGGVTTSTVTVPLVAALGLGLATHVPGRNPLVDGFGVIAFAVMFPMLTVMAYAQLGQWRARRAARHTPVVSSGQEA